MTPFEYGMKLAASGTFKQWATSFKHDPAGTYMSFATANPKKDLLARALMGGAAGYGAYRGVKALAERDPELADTAKERGHVAGFRAGMAGFSAPLLLAGLSSALRSRPEVVGSTPAQKVRSAIGGQAGRGLLMGASAGALLAGIPAVAGTLSKKWAPISQTRDADDIETYTKSLFQPGTTPQYKDPTFETRLNAKDPGQINGQRTLLGGMALGALGLPLLKYGPTAARAAVSAWQKTHGTPPATGAPIHVDFGDAIRKQLMSGR
jgi:hypothetical protein